MIRQKLSLPLSPQVKATLSAFAAAKALGDYREAQWLQRRYQHALENERRAKERKLDFERRRREWMLATFEETRSRREAREREDEKAWIDSLDHLPTGKVSMWRLIRNPDCSLDQTSLLRGWRGHSNAGKRNCGRKPRRSW